MTIASRIDQLEQRFLRSKGVVHIDEMTAELAGYDTQTSQPGFWDDPLAAQSVVKRAEAIRKQLLFWETTETHIRDLKDLAALANEDSSMIGDLEQDVIQLEQLLREKELELLLSGQYDRGDAIVTLHAGTGGVDAMDWTEILLRMYLRYCEQKDYKAVVLHKTMGEEAGIKRATIEVQGMYAYGYLKAEAGVHRLVRLSPFNSDNLRQTSFALVEVLPVVEAKELDIQEGDLVIDTFRAGGAGGQHVNTTDSAIRITHTPTGITVTCQSERSQAQNREKAMTILRARLHVLHEQQQKEKTQELKGKHVKAEWGNQIRSYVMHPYTMVKDHRTDHETSDVQDVLDGRIQPFINDYLNYLRSSTSHHDQDSQR
jgi:peptide chain release factor 2